jgi:serine protease Do
VHRPFRAALLFGSAIGALFGQAPAASHAAALAQGRESLHSLSDSIEALAGQVNRSVVQVFSTGFTLADEDEENPTNTGLITKQRATGSGVILTPDGYIVTNNHVVSNAQHVRVQLAWAPPESGNPEHSIMRQRGKILEAKVIGVDRESDLAVLKIDPGMALPALKLADSEKLRQGQVVMAFGNPLGLNNSVSLGVVSSIGRQIRPDDPMIYIQTDAPINPGNSGGPLVSADGEVVGINTFILSQSGGSEGIGFAIPSAIVKNVFEQIRKDGHVHRGEIGVSAQSITPELAAGLGLKRDWGVILGDVLPDGPADQAGLKPGDIILALDGKPMENARQFEVNLYSIPLQQKVTVEYQRGIDTLKASVMVSEREDDPFRFLDLVKPEDSTVVPLGIVGIAITKQLQKVLPETRKPYGVIVAARSGQPEYSGQGGLKLGDVIYSVNGTPIATLDALRNSLHALKPTDPLVLQVERDNKLMFLTLSEE